MIALDTNVLVHARRSDAEHHAAALRILTGLAEGDEHWALPWPCVYEYLRVVTHPRIFDPPTKLADALADLDSLLASPSLVLLGEGPAHVSHMVHMVEAGRAGGHLAHDAHIAALVVEHGVRELWTTDRDFARFPGLVPRNPFETPAVHARRSRYRTASRGSRATAPRRVARRR